MAMSPGGEMWRKDVLYDIMDGKSGATILSKLDQDPELKTWRCKQAGDECSGMTMLHACVRFQNMKALSELLANGVVGILARGKGGKTPWDWAIIGSEPDMVSAMLACAASGKTPMPNLAQAIKDADAQLESAERSGDRLAEAKETRERIYRAWEEAERKRKEEEAAAAAAAAEALRLL